MALLLSLPSAPRAGSAAAKEKGRRKWVKQNGKERQPENLWKGGRPRAICYYHCLPRWERKVRLLKKRNCKENGLTREDKIVKRGRTRNCERKLFERAVLAALPSALRAKSVAAIPPKLWRKQVVRLVVPPVIQTTKLLVETRSGTWAGRMSNTKIT